jgi:hypothetical protein
MIRFLVVILSIPLLFACKKEKANFVITGKITDNTFKTQLINTEVKLYEISIKNSYETLAQTTTTDANGNYSFTVVRDPIEKYILVCEKKNYFSLRETIQFSSLSIKENNIRNYGVTAQSWVKIRFKKNPTSEPISIRYLPQEGKKFCSQCCSNTEQQLYQVTDTSLICINDGNTNYSIYYWIMNTNLEGLSEINTPPFDTTEMLISN